MNAKLRYGWFAMLAAGLVLVTSQPGFGADDDPPRPGQLRSVISRLRADGKPQLRHSAEWLLYREFTTQLLLLATDFRGAMGGGGWYRPSQSPYGWDWVRQRCDTNGDGEITLAEFGAKREWYEALDKNRDGLLTKDDFDWSTDGTLARASAKARSLFDRIDRNSNGQLSPEEWRSWFEMLAGEKGFVGQDDLIPLFLDTKGPRGRNPSTPAKSPPPNMRMSIIYSYLSGDVGSPSEGPGVGEIAPSFIVRSADGKKSFPLVANREPKPLVLIFGSFT
jgi:hypothetical protein